MLLMGRKLRTKIDLMMPSVQAHVEQTQQSTMSRTANRGCREFIVGDKVQARNYGLGGKWRHGTVMEVLGTRHYNVCMWEIKCGKDTLIS